VKISGKSICSRDRSKKNFKKAAFGENKQKSKTAGQTKSGEWANSRKKDATTRRNSKNTRAPKRQPATDYPEQLPKPRLKGKDEKIYRP